jgi:hypothetical protein
MTKLKNADVYGCSFNVALGLKNHHKIDIIPINILIDEASQVTETTLLRVIH